MSTARQSAPSPAARNKPVSGVVVLGTFGVLIAIEGIESSKAGLTGIGIIIALLCSIEFMNGIGWRQLPYVIGALLIVGSIFGISAFVVDEISYIGVAASVFAAVLGSALINRKMTIERRRSSRS